MKTKIGKGSGQTEKKIEMNQKHKKKIGNTLILSKYKKKKKTALRFIFSSIRFTKIQKFEKSIVGEILSCTVCW